MRSLAALLFLTIAASGCNPNWEPAATAKETPPDWSIPDDDEPHGHGGDPNARGNASANASIAELEKKIEANPNDLESYRQLGQAYDAIGEWDKAAQILQEALVLAP